MKENIVAFGHENITAEHATTIEITKEQELTTQGDCIIGVSANKACVDLSPALKEKLQTNSKVVVTLKVGDIVDKIIGYGSPELTLTHPTDIVLRKSEFACSRTLMIKADKAAKDLKPELVAKLSKPTTKLNFTIEVLDKPLGKD